MVELTVTLWAYVSIVGLTCILVIMNVHLSVAQYQRRQDVSQLVSYMIALLITTALILMISGQVIERVMDSEEVLDVSAKRHVVH